LRQKKWWATAVLILALGGYWYVTQNRQEEADYSVVKPEVRDIVQALSVSGRVDAERKAQLKFAGASRLTWVGVKEGDQVKKWQGIARVDTRTLQKQLAMAQNTHGKTFRSFENTLDSVDYYSQSGLTESERRTAESAQLDISSSALNVEIADLAIQLSLLTSPIDGIVTRIDQPNVGATVMVTDIFEVIDPQSVYFAVVVDEEDIGSLAATQSAVIALDAYPEETVTSQVYRIGFTPTLSESGGTGYEAMLTLPVDNTGRRYKMGMNGDAEIILDRREQVLAVPVDALIEREGITYVEILKDKERERVEVGIGIDDGNWVEVTAGLTVSDQVVIPKAND
jgi:RND family efflux transporter MFP subunit